MLSRTLGAIGRIMITAGTLILLFVAYQLWGTGLQEAKSQDQLSDQLAEILAEVPEATTTTSTTTTTTAPPDGDGGLEVVPREEPELAPIDLPLPKEGDPIAQIQIPSIGVDRVVVEGESLTQLKRGPGHYTGSPLPGQEGNVSVAGHRTTYGQPFHNIDKMEVGDEIIFTTPHGTFTYEMTSHEIVLPEQVEILEDKGDNRITLIACEPKYSAAKRYIVYGKLVGEPVGKYEGQDEALAEVSELAGDSIDNATAEPASKAPAILWGLAAAAVWLVTWLVQVALRRRNRSIEEETGVATTRGQRLLTWSPYLVGVPVFLVVLYVFFENFALLLPASY